MDKNFLEFWGNLLLNTAKGQRQVEDATRWMKQGMSGMQEMTAMFKNIYGIDKVSEQSPDFLKLWKKASDDFSQSYNDYLQTMGMMPKDEHLNLVRKYEELKQKCEAQEETIRHLRMLLSEKGYDQSEAVSAFQGLIKNQSAQFQELIGQFKGFYPEVPANEEKK